MSKDLTHPRRICFYDAFAAYEGSGQMLHLIVQRLDREHFEPVALLPREGKLVEVLRDDGCEVDVLPPEGPLSVYGGRLLASGLRAKLHAAVDLLRYSRRVADWLLERRIELLHCNQTRSALQAGLGAKRAGVPMVWNVRIRERLPRYLVWLGGYCADWLIPLTEDSLDDFPGGARLRAECTVIPNAVDVDRFSPEVDGSGVRAEFGLTGGQPLVLMVGVLARRKAHDDLIRAAPAILRAYPDAHIVIAGGLPEGSDEGYEEELRQLCTDLDVHDRVHLAGRREDIPQMLAACDVFVLPSRREGFPGAVLEAMATGRPVVVTPPASAGVEDGHCGRIVPEDDPEAVAAAVVELLGDPRSARRMGEAGRRHVLEHFSLEPMVRRYEEVYRQLLNRNEE